MPVNFKTKTEKKYIVGKGYCKCQNGGKIPPFVKNLVGRGYCEGGNLLTDSILPFVKNLVGNKELIQKIGDTAASAFTVGKNTRDIVRSIRSRKDDVGEILDRIKKLHKGSGFEVV